MRGSKRTASLRVKRENPARLRFNRGEVLTQITGAVSLTIRSKIQTRNFCRFVCCFNLIADDSYCKTITAKRIFLQRIT